MNICEQIAAHVSDAFYGDNWTEVNLADTVSDINYTEATTVTKASPNSIAMLVHHLKFYNEVVLARLGGTNPKISSANGFDMLPVTNEDEWKKLVADCMESAANLAKAAFSFPADQLEKVPAGGHNNMYKNLHGIAEHAHYHIGQITILKRIVQRNLL